MMKRSVYIVLLVVSCAATALGANPKDELKGVRQEIRAKKQLITKTRKVEAVVSTELREINRNLEQKRNDLGKLDSDLKIVESSLDRTGRDIARVTEEANRKKKDIEKRLVSLYKAGEFGALRMFFSSESFPQMGENIRYMRSIVENDKKIFAEYSEKIDQLRSLKSDLERDAAKKERIKDDIALKKREIEQEQGRKSAYLASVRKDRSSYEASLKELKANAARLQAMLTRLEALSRRKLSSRHVKPGGKPQPLPELPAVPDRGFASQKGRMSLPVRGKVIETYGKHQNTDFNSFTFSKGLSVSASAGSEIRSIYDGTVIFADYFKGYGNMVIVDHGGGYFSLYAHAAKILKRVGSDVARNDTLATVGEIDSTKGPMLYFEIRHQGKPLDPAGWVR